MAEAAAAAPESREIRVFLSSTFRDFNEERKLLATQVFPRLNREARKRGVELVEVDLRWGVTQQQAEGGHALGICLQEIERCKPYFIGMLGDSYGSLTPPQRLLLQAEPALLEERSWLEGQIGSASYTELEIQHGLALLLLRQREQQEGHAFFYFRDPAYSDAKADAGEAGWRSDDSGDRQKLEQLRDRIRSSGHPLVEGLQNPKAIGDQIKDDLWALIERLFPEGEQPDALQKEERKHADYRRSRTKPGQYVGGGAYIDLLERWIAEDQQQILITGESGAGKSALIANWIERHAQSHPADVVYAHHLGCTNDANALRPMLGRLIDTASAQLLEAEVITEALAVPEDWWELVAKVAETLQSMGRWCEQNGKRWIWVLDGLDRLDPDDQNTLPWLPQTLPAGVQVVASALACPVREILKERGYTTLSIEPLAAGQQEQLIQRYLQRYTKELDGGLSQQILGHPLAGSPLFLRVLLEELRQCGRHDTLKSQLDFYLSSQTIDDLYERVLQRLENDGSGEAVRKVMTAIWASRAGLTETELLEIRELAPLQWAPIDLALEKAFGRNGNRLVFDHDFLRIAVQDRYLPTEEARRQAHSELADWYGVKKGWDERKAEEWPWQLQQAERRADLRTLLLNVSHLFELAKERDEREVINYWLSVKGEGDGELDELIADDLEKELEKRREDAEDLIWFVDRIAALFDEAGLYREPLLKLRALSLELEEATEDREETSMLSSLALLARAHHDMGHHNEAESQYLRCLDTRERLLGSKHPDTLETVGDLGRLFADKGDYEQAEAHLTRCLEASERLLGPEHPDTLVTVHNLATLFVDKGDFEQTEAYSTRCLEAQERLLGPEHPSTLITVNNLAGLYRRKGDYEQAEAFYTRCLEARERLLGPEHPDTLVSVNNLALLNTYKGDYEQAKGYYTRCLKAQERLLGGEHPHTLTTVGNLAGLFQDKGDYEQAEAYYTRCLEARERLLGPEHPSTLIIVSNLAGLFQDKGDYEQAEAYYTRCLEARERLLGPEHPSTLTTVGNLGNLYRAKGEYEQAEAYYKRDLEASERLLGPEHPSTLTTVGNLGLLYSDKGDYEQAEAFYKRDLEASERRLGPEHPSTLTTVGNLAGLFQDKGDYEQAMAYSTRCLEARERRLGPEHPDTLTTVGNLGLLYSDKGDYEQAMAYSTRCLEARERLLGPEHPDTLTTVGNLGLLYRAKGDYEQAEAYYKRCLEARERLLGPEHPNTNDIRYSLANLLSDQERYDESIRLRRLELEVAVTRDGRDGAGTLTSIHRLAEDLYWTDELQESEQLYREALNGRIAAHGDDDGATMASRYGLARCLSEQGRYGEAIELRRVELAWCRESNGDIDAGTLTSINDLAIDLRETGELEEAEALFRKLVAARQQGLEPGDFEISRALGGLAKTLEQAGKLKEALVHRQQAFDHRLAHEGPDAWWTNRARVDLARVLHKLERNEEATALLQELMASMNRNDAPDDADRQLLSDAEELMRAIEEP